jgi:hypothetical protein
MTTACATLRRGFALGHDDWRGPINLVECRFGVRAFGFGLGVIPPKQTFPKPKASPSTRHRLKQESLFPLLSRYLLCWLGGRLRRTLPSQYARINNSQRSLKGS